MMDLILIGGPVTVFLSLLVMGYFSYCGPNPNRPWLKKSILGVGGLQIAVLVFFAWLFGTSARQVNHLKWIAPLIFVFVLMWVCYGIGFGLAAVRHRIKTK